MHKKKNILLPIATYLIGTNKVLSVAIIKLESIVMLTR